MIKLQCPHCGNKMLYQPQKGKLGRKTCVYCGKSYKVTVERVRE